MVFDLEKGSTLYIDLAKSNSRSKRSRTGLNLILDVYLAFNFLILSFSDFELLNCVCIPDGFEDQMMNGLAWIRKLEGLLDRQ